MRTLRAFVRLSRPHFLLGGALMFALGAATTGEFDRSGYVLGQVMVTAAQITAHYVNEWADIEPDRLVANRTLFSGGSGVLPGGELSPTVARRAAVVTSEVSVLAAAGLVTSSPAAAGLGVVALVISWAYSAPPFRLLGTGFGELATSLVVAGVVPLIGVFSQGGTPDATLWWAIGVLVPVHVAMMLGFEIPDIASDRAAGKTVIAVRIGRRRTGWLIMGLLAGAAAVGTLGAAAGGVAGGVVLVPGAAVALGFAATVRGERYGLMTMGAVATLVVTAAGLAVAALM